MPLRSRRLFHLEQLWHPRGATHYTFNLECIVPIFVLLLHFRIDVLSESQQPRHQLRRGVRQPRAEAPAACTSSQLRHLLDTHRYLALTLPVVCALSSQHLHPAVRPGRVASSLRLPRARLRLYVLPAL